MVTNGAIRFGCVVPFGTTHFLFKEENPMKKVLALLLTLAFVLSLVACGGSGDVEPTESIEEIVVGSWHCTSGEPAGYYNIGLFEGGTGEAYNSFRHYTITWEMKGNVINITGEDNTLRGLKYEDDHLVGVDTNKAEYERRDESYSVKTCTLLSKDIDDTQGWNVEYNGKEIIAYFNEGEDISSFRPGDTVDFRGDYWEYSNGNIYNVTLAK